MAKSMMDHALEYVAQGFRVFPVAKDKKPLTEHGLKDATQTQLGVQEYWTKWPDAGIGLVTDGLVVLDFDTKSGHEDIQTKYGKLPKTRTHLTGGGGLHYIYRNRNGTDIRNTTALGGYQGVDIRANGGYIVVPPSPHESGKIYKVFDTSPIITAPEWLITLCKQKQPSTITNTTTTEGKIPQGQRNHTLASIAGTMRKRGLTLEAVTVALRETNLRQCDPPLPQEDVDRIAISICRYSPGDIEGIGNGIRNLYIGIYNKRDENVTERERDKSVTESVTGAITEWVKGTAGWWTTDDLDRELLINNPKLKENRRQIIHRLKEQGIIEQHPKLNKQFRYVNKKITDIDFKHAKRDGVLQIAWPLHIENWVNLFPGNIVVVAGAPNAGKTALLLNFIWLNQFTFPIHYFCSEMGEDGVELRNRLEKFPNTKIEEWAFHAHDQSSMFEDVIIPDCINVVDYMEMTDELWLVNAHLTAISHKLGTGLAIVAIQKKVGATYGRGQEFGLEKPRMYLSLDKGQLTIAKGKAWATTQDPTGLKCRFKITDGCQFEIIDSWYWEK